MERAQWPTWFSAARGRRLPATALSGTAALIRARRSGVRVAAGAAALSSRWSMLLAPGIGTMSGLWLNGHAMASWAGVHPMSEAIGMRGAQRFGTNLGQAEMAHLPGFHQLGHRPNGLLDWDGRVTPVQVVQVDGVHTQSAQGVLTRLPGPRRAGMTVHGRPETTASTGCGTISARSARGQHGVEFDGDQPRTGAQSRQDRLRDDASVGRDQAPGTAGWASPTPAGWPASVASADAGSTPCSCGVT